MLALTSSHSFSSPGVETNQSNVTFFDLIRSNQTCSPLLVRRQLLVERKAERKAERKLSNLVPALIGWTRESHQFSQQFACGATIIFDSHFQNPAHLNNLTEYIPQKLCWFTPDYFLYFLYKNTGTFDCNSLSS